MSSKVNDAYTVLLREKKLPLQLLEDPDKKKSGKEARVNILNSFSFKDTFGPNRKRKRPKLMADSLDELAQQSEVKEEKYDARPVNAPQSLADELKDQVKESLFEKGQSKRIWGELYKVLDSSDVIIQVRRRRACVTACAAASMLLLRHWVLLPLQRALLVHAQRSIQHPLLLHQHQMLQAISTCASSCTHAACWLPGCTYTRSPSDLDNHTTDTRVHTF